MFHYFLKSYTPSLSPFLLLKSPCLLLKSPCLLLGSSFGYGSIPIFIPFLVGWTSINTSYFDVNYRGFHGFWHTAICVGSIPHDHGPRAARGAPVASAPTWAPAGASVTRWHGISPKHMGIVQSANAILSCVATSNRFWISLPKWTSSQLLHILI